MDFDEGKVEERRRLIDHCDYFFRPDAPFYEVLEEAIALAAADHAEKVVTFDGHLVPATELIGEYQLEEFVEWAKRPKADDAEAPLRGFEPRFPD